LVSRRSLNPTQDSGNSASRRRSFPAYEYTLRQNPIHARYFKQNSGKINSLAAGAWSLSGRLAPAPAARMFLQHDRAFMPQA
jgi:hypothetical protein